MKYKYFVLCFLLTFSYSCQENEYKPSGLTKLTDEELIERAKQKRLPNFENIIYKNQNGEIITTDSIRKIENLEEWTVDSYVNDEGDVKEFFFRKANDKDKELLQKINRALNYQPPLELVDIDCQQQKEILQRVLNRDQEMRIGGESIDTEMDHQNLRTVISLIEKCGMPTLKEVDKVHMTAIWLVFQHADNVNRKRYLPVLEKAAKNGDLEAKQIAMMKDRTLMMDGMPQTYGTQVTKEEDEWVLYELEEPETVNKRRAAVGFEPLEDYLKRWDIEFNVKQAN